jgi:hypothetical protein
MDMEKPKRKRNSEHHAQVPVLNDSILVVVPSNPRLLSPRTSPKLSPTHTPPELLSVVELKSGTTWKGYVSSDPLCFSFFNFRQPMMDEAFEDLEWCTINVKSPAKGKSVTNCSDPQALIFLRLKLSKSQ